MSTIPRLNYMKTICGICKTPINLCWSPTLNGVHCCMACYNERKDNAKMTQDDFGASYSDVIYDTLKERFKHGHPDFLKITFEELELHDRKNHDYAAGGDPLGNFKRVSELKQLYPKMDWSTPVGVCLSFMLKQFDAALYMLSNKHEAKVEGIDERLKDVHVYIKIARCILSDEAKAKKS